MRMILAALTMAAVWSFASPVHAVHPCRCGACNKHAAIAAYGRAVYPKYYWGFHARALQNAGVPHGDIGMLGSGLTRDPW